VSPEPRVVAELGRPETPQETADRKAESRRKHYANQTTFNLVIALIASLAIVLFLVIVVVRPDQQSAREPVDYAAAASDVQDQVDAHLVVPELGKGWSANRADYSAPKDKPAVWRIGFITPGDQYIGLTQGIGADDGWVSNRLDDHTPTGSVKIDGVAWTVYDRRDAENPGNLAYSLTTTVGDSRLVLSGSATPAEFRTLAKAALADAAASSTATTAPTGDAG
jgi:hypothetical protein